MILLPVAVSIFLSLVVAQADSTDGSCGYTAVNGLTSQRNNKNCHPFLDDAFVPYNAYYNGTLTLALTGNPEKCDQQNYSLPDYSFAIGGMKVPGNATLDRTSYDKNPWYLWGKYQENKDISAGFLSSSDYYVSESQWWTLGAIKSGDGFELSGNYTGKLAPESNVYNYPSDGCWSVNIYNYIMSTDTSSAKKYHYWTLSGHVTPSTLSLVIDQTIFDGKEWHTRFEFIGNAWTTGAKLVTTGDAPSTDAVVKSVSGNSGSGSGSGSESGSGSGSGSGNGTSGTGKVTNSASSQNQWVVWSSGGVTVLGMLLVCILPYV